MERKLVTSFYDKRGDFNFPIVKFTILGSNIPSAHAYAVYVSHHVLVATVCCKYQNFVSSGKLLFLLSSKFCHNCRAQLVSTVEKFFRRHLDIVDPYNVAASRLSSDFMPSAEAY